MNTFFKKKFEENVIKQLNIIYGSSILLAISGGQDSLCLLQLFLQIKMKYNLRLGIINIDHQWREDTVYNTRHIINCIENINIPVYLYQIQPTLYSELESRNYRYQIFLDTAKRHKYSMIATAHTSSDQIETCIYNLTRGSTIDGLNSLVWNRKISSKIYLIRPLLNFKRWEIAWICRYFILPIWSDDSNILYNKKRNRIRQEFIPYLKYHLQSQLEFHILTFLEDASISTDYIRQNTVKIYQIIKHESFTAINYHILLSQHLSLQVRVLHLFVLHSTNISLPHKLLHEIIYKMHNNFKINCRYSHITIRNNSIWLYISLK